MGGLLENNTLSTEGMLPRVNMLENTNNGKRSISNGLWTHGTDFDIDKLQILKEFQLMSESQLGPLKSMTCLMDAIQFYCKVELWTGNIGVLFISRSTLEH